MKTAIFFKKTSDNWCPNYPENMVRVKLGALKDGIPRVSVWGKDDIGMNFDGEKAIDIYDKIKTMDSVSFDNLEELGLTFF